MGVDQGPRAAESTAIDDAGVVGGIGDDEVIAPRQSRDDPDVGLVTGREEESGFEPRIGGKLLLEVGMELGFSRDEARRSGSEAVLAGSLGGRGGEGGVGGQAKVVIGTEGESGCSGLGGMGAIGTIVRHRGPKPTSRPERGEVLLQVLVEIHGRDCNGGIEGEGARVRRGTAGSVWRMRDASDVPRGTSDRLFGGEAGRPEA